MENKTKITNANLTITFDKLDVQFHVQDESFDHFFGTQNESCVVIDEIDGIVQVIDEDEFVLHSMRYSDCNERLQQKIYETVAEELEGARV